MHTYLLLAESRSFRLSTFTSLRNARVCLCSSPQCGLVDFLYCSLIFLAMIDDVLGSRKSNPDSVGTRLLTLCSVLC